MKRFFGYGARPVGIANGIVSVVPTRRTFAGFGGIKILEPGTIAAAQGIRDEDQIWTVTGSRTASLASTVPPLPTNLEPVRIGTTAKYAAAFFSPAFIAAGGTATSSNMRSGHVLVPGLTPSSAPPPVDGGEGTPGQYQCKDGKLVMASTVAEAGTKCAALAIAAKNRDTGTNTTTYLLIGGAALVALLLLKK